MAKIVKMENISKVAVPVVLTDGRQVVVAPGGILENVDVAGVDRYRNMFIIREQLNEAAGGPRKHGPRSQI